MRKFLRWTTAVASTVLLSACSTHALYKDMETQETFLRIQDTNPQDLGINAVAYSYEVTGNAAIDALSISMMSGDRLRLTYSKAGKPQFTYIMNKKKSCRLDAAGKNAEILSPAATATLKFFYDINFKTPAKTAEHIALRDVKTVAAEKGKNKKKYYIFDITPKKIYGLKKIILNVDASTRHIAAINFQYPGDEQDMVISNIYKDVTIKSGLTVAQIIESSFLGEKATYKLTEFAINPSVKAADFNVPEIEIKPADKDVKKTK